MSIITSTAYKYVKEQYPISKEHRGAREHQVENPGLTGFISDPALSWSLCKSTSRNKLKLFEI
jgi:hypothetical protein